MVVFIKPRLIINRIITLFASLILLLFGTPGIFLTFGPATVVRWIVFNLAKRYKPNLGKMLSSTSALHVQDNKNSTMVVTSIIEGTPDLKHILEETRIKLLDKKCPSTGELLYPELRQNMSRWMGFEFWTPVKNFKIEDHVYVYIDKNSTSKVIDMSGPDGDRLINNFMVKPWSNDKGLWEIMLLPKVTTASSPPGVTSGCLLARFHHGLSDAASLITLFDNVNCPRAQDCMAKPKFSKISNFKESKCKKALNAVLLPFKAAYDLADGLLRLRVSDPLRSMGTKVSYNVCSGSSELRPISEIKAVAAKHGVSFSVILIAMLTKGIRETMIKRFGKVDREISFHYTIPLPNHPEKLRNHTTLGLITLPLLEESPLKRLHLVHSEIERVRRSYFPRIMHMISILFGCQFSFILKLVLERAKKQSVVVLTNIAWASVPITVYGYPMKEPICAIGVGGTKVLMFGYVSYEGLGKLWVNADTSLLATREDANDMLRECMKELEALKETNFDNKGFTMA